MKFRLSLIILFFIYILLRLKGLGAQSFWIDEVVSVDFSSFPSWTALFWDNHPPLYHLLLKFWIYLFGFAEFSVRSLSVLFSIGSFCFLISLTKELKPLTRFFVLALYTVSGSSVLIAQEARMYSLFELTVLFNVWAFLRWKEKKQNLQLYGISLILMVLTHYFSIFVILAEILFLLLQNKEKRKRYFLSLLALGLFALTVATLFVDWKFLRWQGQSFQLFSFSAESKQFGSDLFWGLHMAGVLLYLWPLYYFIKNKGFNELLILTVVSCLLLFQILDQRNIFFIRYYSFLTPFLALSLGVAFENYKKIPALLLLPALIYLPQIYTYRKAPWKDVSQYIVEHQGGRVLTSRTLALRSPYFSQSIQLEKWDGSLEQVLAVQDRPLWLIEAYWSGVVQLGHLKDELEKRHISAELLTFQKGESDRILVLKIP